MFDQTTGAAYLAAATAQEKAQAVRDSLGSGTLTVEIRDGETLKFSGTFTGPMTAGEDGSLSRDVVLSGTVASGGTPNASTWACRITNGSRYIEGSFGPGGRFTSMKGDLVAGQSMRLNVSIAAAGAGGGSDGPLWLQGQAVNEWREIEGSSMSLCPPTVNPNDTRNPKAKLDAWCGLSIDTRTSTVWSVANGGHDDYWGNEVNRIGLEADEPAWIEVYRSSSGFTTPNNDPRYSDGKPASAHTYWSQQFIEARDMAMRFGLGSITTQGFPKTAIDGFDASLEVGVDGWSAPTDFPEWPAFNTDMPICKDPTTEDVYCFRENIAVYKWTQATNTISTVSTDWPPNTMAKAASAFDPVRGRIFLASSLGTWTFNPSTGLFTARTLTGAGAAGVKRDQQAMVYDAGLDAFLVLRIVSTGVIEVYKVDPATFEATILSTTGGSPPGDAGALGGSNPYGRFLFVPNLNGCIWFPLYAENGWFLRTA